MSTAPLSATKADAATVSRLHTALASERRRLVLAYFETTDEDMASLADLATFISTHQADSERERVRGHLRHADLPKLADLGLIDYDARTQTSRYWGAPSAVVAEEWTQYLRATVDP
ncbi:hypothetical protein HALDL1_12975 [Halobacterium sp. DL1]|jgi:hypothetical protein|nr:hypothetical protein HALDL1_12975 [Halobacterium sp. DL1]